MRHNDVYSQEYDCTRSTEKGLKVCIHFQQLILMSSSLQQLLLFHPVGVISKDTIVLPHRCLPGSVS